MDWGINAIIYITLAFCTFWILAFADLPYQDALALSLIWPLSWLVGLLKLVWRGIKILFRGHP